MSNPNPFISPATGAAGLPTLTAAQANALLRSGAAIACELLSRAFPPMIDLVRDGLAGRWDFDVGSPIVQRLLATKSEALRLGIIERLPQRQDAALLRLGSSRSAAAPALELDAARMELVDDSEDRGEGLAAQAARRMRGILEQPMRDLELVVGFLGGREGVAPADNPFGPETVVPALLDAAIALDLHREAWSFLLSAF